MHSSLQGVFFVFLTKRLLVIFLVFPQKHMLRILIRSPLFFLHSLCSMFRSAKQLIFFFVFGFLYLNDDHHRKNVCVLHC